MPHTASAERRVSNSARKHLHNRAIKSKLKSVEKGYDQLVRAWKKDEAAKALSDVSSALDKAAKTGVIHRATASRKRSRLARRLLTIK